ncbi:MAG: aldose epimerase family protein [Flavisolibacter sp.]
MNLNPERFISTAREVETGLHLLTNSKGSIVAITNYGARIVSMVIHDQEGKTTDVVVGFDSIEGYLNSTETYYSAIVGRYANRIAGGRFSLDGKTYQLAINNPPNHLHGGPFGFHNQVWTFEDKTGNSVRLSYLSKDGEENYPGNLKVDVSYTLTDEDELVIQYEASTDQPTIINLTSHPFFNLNGQGSGTIENHILQVNAVYYNPVDENLIPTGVFPVAATPFDFLVPATIGEKINEENEQLKFGNGYDHNLVLDGTGFRKVASVKGDLSGISMEVHTDQPGMQLYSGNYMKGENQIKGGEWDRFREAFCLETQHFPDAPNQPEFPPTRLEPGAVFKSKTVYHFK